MQISNVYFSSANLYNTSPKNQEPVSFTSAADLNLFYMLERNAKYLPERVRVYAEELCKQALKSSASLSEAEKKVPTLIQVHNKVYAPIQKCETLEELQKNFPEFEQAQSAVRLQGNRSIAVKAILSRISLEEFTLDYIKRLYLPTKINDLVTHYNMPNRNLFDWLNQKLHINKLPKTYIQLLKMADETENAKVAEASRNAIYRNPQAQAARLIKAKESNQTPEARERSRQRSKKMHLEHPEYRKRTRLISKLTWDRCSEIKEIMKQKIAQNPHIKILMAKRKNNKLSPKEEKILSSFYKSFWENHPELKEKYRTERLNVIQELKAISD